MEMPTTIKLTDYLNEKKAKYIEMDLKLEHGQKYVNLFNLTTN